MTGRTGEHSAAVPTRTEAPQRRSVLLVDAPQSRVRRPADLVSLAGSVLGIVFVLLLAVYAHGTTQGVTEDVQSAVATTLRQVLLLPVTVLEGLVTFFVPVAVLVDRLVRRSWRSVLEAAATGAVGVLLAVGAIWVLDTFAAASLTRGLTITSEGDTVIALNTYAAGIAGLLTVVGDRSHTRLLRWSWILLWVVLGLAVVQGDQTLPGAVVAVLLGRCAGLGTRYASGVLHERATGVSLVRGLRRAGLDPVQVVRLDPLADDEHVEAWTVTTSSPIGYTERLRNPARDVAEDDDPAALAHARHRPAGAHGAAHDEHPGGAEALAHGDDGGPVQVLSPAELVAAVDEEVAGSSDTIAPEPLVEPDRMVAEATARAVPHGVEAAHRLYGARDADGTRYEVTVLDGDRHVVGFLAGLWDSIRLRGLDRRPAANMREAASRAALMAYATRDAGVRSPRLVGITESRDSVLMISEHVPGTRALDELDEAEIDDGVLDQVWSQLRAAHAKGLAHRDLHAGSVLVDAEGQVWVTGWEDGEIISSELARRLDLAQLLAMLAVLVGTDRALGSAARVLGPEQMASMAPLLQAVAMPARTRAASGNLRDLLAGLRSELVALVPTADVPTLQLARFSVRTVVTVTIAVIALWVLLSSLNFEEVTSAIVGASPAWMVVAFLLGLLTYLGSAMGLVAFSPARLGLWRTTLVQVAASVVSLVAPAGIGPAALNLRYLNQAKIATPLAVATVGLVQVSQFITTILLLVVLALVTGSAGSLSAPTPAVIGAVVLVLVAIGVALLVPPLRAWLWAKAAPTLQQVGPRVVWIVSNPKRLLTGLAGNLIMTSGYVAAFGASLAAFGYALPLTNLAITYLASNSVGAVVPSPGGIGPVEAALTGGLTLAGIPLGSAVSVAILFRVLTFWGRVPFGWAALRYLQRRDSL